MTVGVEQAFAVEHDADMALPKDQVAAPEPHEIGRRCDGLAERGLLHVGVTRRRDAGGGERDLDQTRAVEAETRLATPQVGRAYQAFGDGDEVRLACVHV